MKIRYFLKGLGTGILITTFILYFSYKNDISDAEIILKAKKLGMVYAEDVSGSSLEITKSTNTPKPAITKAPALTFAPSVTEKPVVTAGPEEKPEPVATEEPVVTEKPVVTEEPEVTTEPIETERPDNSEELISFTISRGDWSRVVSERLESLGIVDDAKELDKYLVEKGYAVRIKVGTFELKKGSSYEEVAKMITK